jgi:hypothetical protein
MRRNEDAKISDGDEPGWPDGGHHIETSAASQSFDSSDLRFFEVSRPPVAAWLLRIPDPGSRTPDPDSVQPSAPILRDRPADCT